MSNELNDRLTRDLGEEERFLLRVAAVLDTSVQSLPPALIDDLDRARHAAMLGQQDVNHHEPGQQAIVQTLEDSAGQLPAGIHARLDSIRAKAMQRARETSGRPGWQERFSGLALPASAFASVCVLVVALAVFRQPEPQELMPVLVADDALLLASEVELELYENLEFYQWLADNGLQY
ncbi:MAG: DUF3619 family protein [Pseudomonadales bacterium]|nr:DUF3619 family protein [Pseudomonadales bacterium]MCP5330732.1 DUF3619 family protein [Pseudomonadales bacterium]MCP5345061.1 DUF3619 family protein [Pseudomonadales bacterium]